MIRILATLLMLITTATQADTLTSHLTGHSLRDEGKFSAGYEDWRKRTPGLTLGQQPAQALTPDVLPVLERVNAAVNHQIRYQDDHGPDHWDVSPAQGDCDDYAVTKLVALTSAGVPRTALRIVVAVTDRGTLHGVLAAEISGTTVILDNRVDDVLPWDRTGLTFRAMEVVNDYGVAYLATLAPR